MILERYIIEFYRYNIFDELAVIRRVHAEFESYDAARVWAQNELYHMPNNVVRANVFIDF